MTPTLSAPASRLSRPLLTLTATALLLTTACTETQMNDGQQNTRAGVAGGAALGALTGAIVSKDKGKGAIIALVDIGANQLNVTVLRDGVQVYTREQAFGGHQLTQDIARHYGMSTEEAEAAKRSGSHRFAPP